MYKYLNMNPMNRNVDDCVIRSLSALTGKSWREMQEELSYFARLDGRMLDDVAFVEDYLDKRYPRECHYAKTVGEFAREYPNGKYAVTMPNHIVAVVNGLILDTFDPSDRTMRCAWKIRG